MEIFTPTVVTTMVMISSAAALWCGIYYWRRQPKGTRCLTAYGVVGSLASGYYFLFM